MGGLGLVNAELSVRLRQSVPSAECYLVAFPRDVFALFPGPGSLASDDAFQPGALDCRSGRAAFNLIVWRTTLPRAW
jgi:hypothetical protein